MRIIESQPFLPLRVETQAFAQLVGQCHTQKATGDGCIGLEECASSSREPPIPNDVPVEEKREGISEIRLTFPSCTSRVISGE